MKNNSTTQQKEINYSRSSTELPSWRDQEGVKIRRFRKNLEQLRTIRALGADIRPEAECKGDHELLKLAQATILTEWTLHKSVIFYRCVYCNIGVYESEVRFK